MKKNTKKANTKKILDLTNLKVEIIILCALFLLATGIYFYLANHVKIFGVYHDDLRHYDMARSIFNGQGLTIHHANWYFQKIFYPLCISPFFAISDVYLRMSMIALFNSFFLALSIFPLWLIAKELKMDARYRLACVILFLFTPMIVYNEMCFSESLYSPILLMFIYLLMVNHNKQNYLLSIGLGVYSYLLYLTKEAGIIFVVCYVLFELLYPLFQRLAETKENRLVVSCYYDKKHLINGAIHLGSFLVCFLIFKFTLFRGWPNSYDTGNDYDLISLAYLFKDANFGWFIYGIIYAFVAAIAVVIILPLVYPIMTFKSLNERQKELTVFIMLVVIVSSVVFSYTLTIREDIGIINPRLHHRYISPIFNLLVVLFIDILRNREQTLKSKNHRPLNIAVFISCALVFLFFKGGNVDVSVESSYLAWHQFIWYNMPSFEINGVTIYSGWIVGNLVMIVAAVGVHFYIIKAPSVHLKPDVMAYTVLFAFSIITIRPSINAAYNKVEYIATQEVISINNFVKSLPEEEQYVLYIARGAKKPVNNYSHIGIIFDDYFDQTKNLYYSTTGKMLSYVDYLSRKTTVNINEMEFLEWYNGYVNPTPSHINYLVIPCDTTIEMMYLDNLEIVRRYTTYTLYKNVDPLTIRYSL